MLTTYTCNRKHLRKKAKRKIESYKTILYINFIILNKYLHKLYYCEQIYTQTLSFWIIINDKLHRLDLFANQTCHIWMALIQYQNLRKTWNYTVWVLLLFERQNGHYSCLIKLCVDSFGLLTRSKVYCMHSSHDYPLFNNLLSMICFF